MTPRVFWVGQKHTRPMLERKEGVQSMNEVWAGSIGEDGEGEGDGNDGDDDSLFARAKKQATARSFPPAVTNIFTFN